MNKQFTLVFFSLGIIFSSHSSEKPLMSAHQYMSYRYLIEGTGDGSIWTKKYRLPTEDEKRSYIYANYAETLEKLKKNQDTPLPIGHLGDLCEWLLLDDPVTNTPFVVRYVHDRNTEAALLREQNALNMRKVEHLAAQASSALSEVLGDKSFPYLLDLIEESSGLLQRSILEDIRLLFSDENTDDVEKDEWVKQILDVYPNINQDGRRDLARMLIDLQSKKIIKLTFSDLIWMYEYERSDLLLVYDRAFQNEYKEEYIKWQKSQLYREKKEGSARTL